MGEKILQFIRRWWRPLTQITIAITMFVHGVLVPLVKLYNHSEMDTDLTALSLLVTAIAGTFAVREWGKSKGIE